MDRSLLGEGEGTAHPSTDYPV